MVESGGSGGGSLPWAAAQARDGRGGGGGGGGERAAAGRVRRGAGMRSWRCSLFNVPLRCCISDNPVALPLTVSRVFFARFYLESVYCLSTTQR